MSSRPAFDPIRLDVAAFAAGRGSIDGSWPLRSLARLAESTVPLADGGEDPVQWKAEGALAPLLGAGLQPALRIVADAAVGLECQRCLQRMVVPLRSTGGSSSSPARTPPPASTPRATTTCWRWSRRSTCTSLVEDELLLALPLVPRHEVCPEPLPRRAGARGAGVGASLRRPGCAQARAGLVLSAPPGHGPTGPRCYNYGLFAVDRAFAPAGCAARATRALRRNFMAVQQNKKSPSKRGMHRAHNALAKPGIGDRADHRRNAPASSHQRHRLLPGSQGAEDQSGRLILPLA